MEQIVKKKSVDDYLNEVDYREMNKYIPSPFAISFIDFFKLINGKQISEGSSDYQPSPPAHYRMVEALATKKSRVLNLCSRGFSKTTIFGEALILYLATFNVLPNFGLCDVIMYVSDSMENGGKSIRKNTEFRYLNSDLLQKYIPFAKFTDTDMLFKNSLGKETYVRIFGAKSGVRGFKQFGNRPVLAILDDLVSDEEASSEVQLAKIKEIIYKGIDYCLNPLRYKVVLNGTPFNKNDPIYEAVESGNWDVNVFPICNEFPCKKEDFVSAWKERFTYDFCLEKYKNHPEAFKQEMMLRIATDEDRVVSKDDICWFNRNDMLNDIKNFPGKYHIYITTDFATTDGKKSDYTVIGVWAIDSLGNRYLIDGFAERQLIHITFNRIFEYVSKYSPMAVGIEITGQQGAFISLLKTEMLKRNIFFTFARDKNNKKEGIAVLVNKMQRFRLSVPFFKNKMMFFPNELKETFFIQEILDEINLVTINGGIKSKHDDCLDMISQLEQMNLILPSKDVKNSSEKNVINLDRLDSMIYYGEQDLLFPNMINKSNHSCSDYLA